MNENKQGKTPDYKIGLKANRTGNLARFNERLEATTSVDTSNFTIEELANYQDLYNGTTLWHGSGRFQYDENGKVFDVLKSILVNGGFTPKSDGYDLASDMTSTSLTPDRTYARLYADIHHLNPTAALRHGSTDLLTGFYVGPVEKAALKEHVREFGLRESARALIKARRSLKATGRWSKKVNSAQPSIKQVFSTGSDIEDNYPILYGVADVSDQVPLSAYLAKHEVRTTSRINLSIVTHIEVPVDKVEEVQKILESYQLDITVVAIELGEAFMASNDAKTIKY